MVLNVQRPLRKLFWFSASIGSTAASITFEMKRSRIFPSVYSMQNWAVASLLIFASSICLEMYLQQDKGYAHQRKSCRPILMKLSVQFVITFRSVALYFLLCSQLPLSCSSAVGGIIHPSHDSLAYLGNSTDTIFPIGIGRRWHW